MTTTDNQTARAANIAQINRLLARAQSFTPITCAACSDRDVVDLLAQLSKAIEHGPEAELTPLGGDSQPAALRRTRTLEGSQHHVPRHFQCDGGAMGSRRNR